MDLTFDLCGEGNKLTVKIILIIIHVLNMFGTIILLII